MNKVKEICFIEDDRVQIFLLTKYVEKLKTGYQVSSFANGKLAFDAMEERAKESKPFPDVIFLDINMPVWSGWDFYKAFSKLKGSEKVVVLVLTSSLNDDDYQMAVSYGLTDNYLIEPLGFEKFEKLISKLTE